MSHRGNIQDANVKRWMRPDRFSWLFHIIFQHQGHAVISQWNEQNSAWLMFLTLKANIFIGHELWTLSLGETCGLIKGSCVWITHFLHKNCYKMQQMLAQVSTSSDASHGGAGNDVELLKVLHIYFGVRRHSSCCLQQLSHQSLFLTTAEGRGCWEW